MRRTCLLTVVLLAACSKTAEPTNQNGGADGKDPKVNVSSAPGVSLTYQYGFRMPVERISAAQEDNASQCEALGATRCRITGMTYDVGRDRTVSASLQVKLAPDVARRFGKQSIETVARRGGMLVSSRIESEDSGAVIAAAQQDKASMDGEKARIEKQLAQPGLGSNERRELQGQLSNLEVSTRAVQATQQEAAIKLASTPMTFTYETGAVDQSLSDGPIIGAFKDGWDNIVSGVAVIIMMLVTLIPWLAVTGLGGWLWQRFLRKKALRGGESE